MSNYSRRYKEFDRGTSSGRCEEDDFLVFGYSATLHQPIGGIDGSSAASGFDENRFLIPWNGDESLKIDRNVTCAQSAGVDFRYDVRLYLGALNEFDENKMAAENKGGKNGEEEDTAEKLEEELCEEERFADMYADMQQRQRDGQESEQRRGKGAEIAFTYESENTPKLGEEEEVAEGEEEEEPYEKPETLKLPMGIATPDTMRQNALIERTAQFVVAQGPQMEVVIRAKQRQNAQQFAFLDFDNRLHPYYKYICKLIRETKYTPQPQKSSRRQVKSPSPSSSESGSDDGYLHPLLMGGTKGDSSASPAPGFIGPVTRPPPKKPEKNAASPGPDLGSLVEQFHRSGSSNTLYSSLLKGLHSIMPGVEKTQEQRPHQSRVEEAVGVGTQQQGGGGGTTYETDERRIAEYNKWHFEFYGRPSPYLPMPPPLAFPPNPESAVESGITVAAKYVAVHGASAEQRLIEHNREKVHFLLARSPYYTFYQSRVRQFQWQLHQQQQSVSSLPVQLPNPPAPPASLIQIPRHSSPPNPDLMPTKIPLDGSVASSNNEDTNICDAVGDSKQLERRERARLFMERILNERMAEKRRKAKTNGTASNSEEATPESSTSMAPPIVLDQQQQSVSVSPLALSKAISTLIDHQLKRSLGTTTTFSCLSKESSGSGEDGEEDSEEEDERRRRRKRRRERERRERDRSSQRRRHRRHRSRSGSRSRSRSRSPTRRSSRRYD